MQVVPRSITRSLRACHPHQIVSPALRAGLSTSVLRLTEDAKGKKGGLLSVSR